MKKKLLTVMLIALLVFAFTSCGKSSEAGEENYNLQFSLAVSESNFQAESWRTWADAVTEATDGRVTFTFYYDDTLIDANAEYQQLLSGVADIADVHRYANDGFNISEVWKSLTSGIPEDAAVDFSYRLYEEFDAISDEFKDVKVLAQGFNGGTMYQLLTVNKEVKQPSDMAGLTIWCEADWNGFVEKCGATPVNTPFSEVYSSLQKNMYDGLMIAAETLQSCNFAEVCDYVTMINFCYMSGPGHLMNMDVYNSLPDDLKAIINDEELIKKLEDANREDGFGLEESSIKWAQDTYGVTVVTPTEEAEAEFLELLTEAKGTLAEKLDSQGLPGTQMVEAVAEWAAQ